MPKRRFFHEIDGEEALNELCNYEIGGDELCELMRPLAEKCAEIAKDQKEFMQCINEAFTTTLKVVKKKKEKK